MSISTNRTATSPIKRIAMGVVGAMAALTLAACSGGAETVESEDVPESGNEDVATEQSANTPEADALETLVPGKLTIATGEPAFSPWVENDDPESGEGLEAAVAYAVAEQMGFAPENVVWIRTPFDTVIAPGPKDFDINIQQFSVTEERKQAVDFSSPYYVTTQAILAVDGTPGADATTLDDLEGVHFGVASGSNAAAAIEQAVGPDANISVFNNNDDAVAALNSGQVDAIVTDLPTILYLNAAVVDNSTVVGQFEPVEGDGDEFAFLLPKDSPLTEPVTKAVDTLRDNGTLAELAEVWLADYAGAPVLTN